MNHSKLIGLLLFFLTANITLSQAEMKPYIETKGGSATDYGEVETTFFGKYCAINGESKTKYSRKELKSVLIGKTGTYSTSKYAQLVFKKLRLSKGLFKYSVEDGNTPYEIIVSNGTDMVLSEWNGTITCKGTAVRNYFSSSTYGSNYDMLFYVKGTSAVLISEFNMFKAEFLDELIASFSSCDAVKTLLIDYKDSFAKPITAFEAIYNVKDAYYNNCYLK